MPRSTEKLQETLADHAGRLAEVERRHDQADDARRQLESNLLQKLTAIEHAILGLTEVVKTQGAQLASQNTRNDLQDTELSEIRKLLRFAERAKTTGKFGGLATVLYALFELWVQHGS